VCAREGFVFDVVHRMGVELLKYFLYDAGGVDGVLMYVGVRWLVLRESSGR